MILHTFNNQGFINNLNVFKELDVLDKIKQKIYEYTKNNLEDHETNLSLDQKLKLKFKKNNFPQAENFHREVLSIPIHPSLKEEQQSDVIDTLKGILSK